MFNPEFDSKGTASEQEMKDLIARVEESGGQVGKFEDGTQFLLSPVKEDDSDTVKVALGFKQYQDSKLVAAIKVVLEPPEALAFAHIFHSISKKVFVVDLVTQSGLEDEDGEAF